MGIPGAGKSTFCKKCLTDYGRINLDTLGTRKKEKVEFEELMKIGKNIVIDNTNCKKDDRLIYILMAMRYGYKTVGYYFNPNLKDSLRRNRNRERKVPEDAIRNFRKLLQKNKPSYEEGFDELYKVINDDKDFQIIEF